MRVRRLKLWSWSDYRYPLAFFGGLTAVLGAVCMTVGMVGLFSTTHSQDRVIDTFSSDSTCRSGIATSVDVVLLDAFHYVLAMPARDSAEAARLRADLLQEITDARKARAGTAAVCNSAGTTVPTPLPPPPPAVGTPEKASTP
jgi:hypothetical protein